MATGVRAGGQEFPAEIIARIRALVRRDVRLTRTRLSQLVCEWLAWRQANGKLREVSCRVALRTLERRGVIELPPARSCGGKHARSKVPKPSQDFTLRKPAELPDSICKLGPIELVIVQKSSGLEFTQWKEAIERFHPEGYVALAQAHVRYLIRCRHGVLGAMCFSAAARQVAARDLHIGWDSKVRTVRRELVVANSRFLLLPWVRVKDLASHVLARAAKQLPDDWQRACGVRPVLLETYVDASRYRGSCYRAAGWQKVGLTSGRTRNDRSRKRNAARRDIYLLPLTTDYRQRLSQPLIGRKPDCVRSAMSWARREMLGADLGDPRRLDRLVSVLEDFYAKPNASLPQACHHSWGRMKGAYRLLGNPDLCLHDILAPHYSSTAERMAKHPVVLAVQDTTSLNYTAHPATTGLGPIGGAPGIVGLEVHDTVVFTPTGLPLGLVHVQVWARDPQQFGKRVTRRYRPIEQKESYKWLNSFEAAAQAQRLCPQTRVVSVGDREADLYELFELALSRHDHPHLLVRATADRCVKSAHREGLLWEIVEGQAEAGTRELRVPRTANRPERQAQLSIRFCEVELQPPQTGPSTRRALRVWAVLAREEQPPPDVTPLEWMLLTTVEVGSLSDAIEKIEWYTRRFGIEVYHHTLKSGCLIEERQFGSATGLTNCLAVDMIIAWRLLYMTRLGREVPALPCTAVFTADEWQSLHKVTYPRKRIPKQPPPLSEVIGMIARLGGHPGRTADGPPGVQSLWIGLARLADICMCWRLFGPSAHARAP